MIELIAINCLQLCTIVNKIIITVYIYYNTVIITVYDIFTVVYEFLIRFKIREFKFGQSEFGISLRLRCKTS